jgi:hypothetical protein
MSKLAYLVLALALGGATLTVVTGSARAARGKPAPAAKVKRGKGGPTAVVLPGIVGLSLAAALARHLLLLRTGAARSPTPVLRPSPAAPPPDLAELPTFQAAPATAGPHGLQPASPPVAAAEPERVVWSAPFKAAHDAEGVLTVTTHRLMAHFREPVVTLWPPSRRIEERRVEEPLAQLVEVETSPRRHASLLGAGLLCFWIYPLGTLLAALALTAYGTVSRAELAVRAPLRRYRFPLAAVDLGDAMQALRSQAGGPRP